MTQIGSRKRDAADEVDPDARALGHHAVEQVDAHMLVDLERIGRAEQHHAGEHVPLHFEPGVRADAEQVAAGGIAGADQAGEQHEPVGNHAELVVDRSRWPGSSLEQALHTPSPLPDTARSGPRYRSVCRP